MKLIHNNKDDLLNLKKVVADQKKKTEQLEHEIFGYKQIEKTKDREINTLRSQNENLAAAEITLTKDLANGRKHLKEIEGKVKEAEQQGRAKSKEHSEFARN